MRVYTFPPESPCFSPRKKSVTWRRIHACMSTWLPVCPGHVHVHVHVHVQPVHASPCVSMRLHASPCMSMPLHACTCREMCGHASLLFSPRIALFFPQKVMYMAWTWRGHGVDMASPRVDMFLGEKQGISGGNTAHTRQGRARSTTAPNRRCRGVPLSPGLPGLRWCRSAV